MSHLIGVTGYKNSGKNAVCNVLRDEFGYVITGFADILKSMALAIDPIIFADSIFYDQTSEMKTSYWRLSELVAMGGWDQAKERYPEIRRFLQVLGTEGVRDHLGQNVWIDAWHATVFDLLSQGHKVCVSDVRFINEADAIKRFGGEVWRVIRPGTATTAHASETELDHIVVQRRVYNDGDLKALSVAVRKMMA